jgi:hypothetical protein
MPIRGPDPTPFDNVLDVLAVANAVRLRESQYALRSVASQ